MPFSEALFEEYGCTLGELVPFSLDYPCVPVEVPANAGEADARAWAEAIEIEFL